MRYVEVERVRGARVYDSYGLYYGYVCGTAFDEQGVSLRVCVDVEYERYVPDAERVKRMLEERGVRVEELSLEELVELARRNGIDVPMVRARARTELVKAVIGVRELQVVDETEDGSVVILLSTPRQARYRGVEVVAKPVPSPDTVRGKPVISRSRGYLGTAETIVIGPGRVGVKAVKRLGLYLAWPAFVTALRRRGFSELASKLVEAVGDPLDVKRLDPKGISRVRSLLESYGAPQEAYRVLEASVREEERKETVVPWEEVLYVTDAVVAK